MARTLIGEFDIALHEHNYAEVQRLINDHRDVIIRDEVFLRSISIAVEKCTFEVIDFLLANGASILGSTYGNPICEAIRHGRYDLIEGLVTRGAPLEDCSWFKRPLWAAVRKHDANAVTLLLELGVDAQKSVTFDGGYVRNMMEMAKEDGLDDIVRLLADAGCTLPDNSNPILRLQGNHNALFQAITKQLGDPKVETIDEFPLRGTDWTVKIYLAQPTSESPCQTVFTVGMSDRWYGTGFEVRDGSLELMLQLDSNQKIRGGLLKNAMSYWPLKWLKKIAKSLHTETIIFETSKPYEFIPNGEQLRPLGPRTQFCSMGMLPDQLACCPIDLGHSKLVHYYQLVPIYAEELKLANNDGVEAFLKKLTNAPEAMVIRDDRDPFV